MRFRPLIGLAALLLAPTFVGAQVVRGAVLDKGTGAPVSGIVVVLLDSAGSVLQRDLTDTAGRYRLRAPRSGAYRVRTLRIGFRPFTSETFAVGSPDEIERQIIVSSVPVSLDTIRVVSRSACRALDDSSAVMFRIWEQAQTALTALQLSNTRSMLATIVTYQRWEHPARDHVLEQERQVVSAVTRSPWHSISPDSVRAAGYVTLDTRGWTTYHAPDLDVLLSDSFVEDHCFRVAEASHSKGQLGVAFEPTPARRRVPEIQGTVWFDRGSSELRRIEFEYVNVPRPVRAMRAGGNLEFVRLRDGTWTISRWSLRFPEIESRQTRTGAHLAAGTVTEEYVSRVRVEGGELSLVMRRGDTLWKGLPSTLTGFVVDSSTGRAVSHAKVSLRGTSAKVVSDVSGQFRFSDAIPGRYLVEVRTPSLDSIGAAEELRIVHAASDSLLVIRVPNAEQVAWSRCGPDTTGVIAGRIRMRDGGRSPSRVRIVATWTDPGTRSAEGSEQQRWRDAVADASGAYHICQLPLGKAFELRVESDSGRAMPVRVELPVERRFLAVELTVDSTSRGTGSLAGVVVADGGLEPLSEVEISIPLLGRRVRTNERGQFRLSDIEASEHEVVVRRIGYQQISQSVVFSPGRSLQREYILSRVRTLDTIAVTANRRMSNFEENRKIGLGRFLTRAEIEKMENRKMAEILESVGAFTLRVGWRAWVTGGNRGPRSLMNRGPMNRGGRCAGLEGGAEKLGCQCFAHVYLDDNLIYNGEGGSIVPDINAIAPASIEAIEFYKGPATTPLKYSRLNSECGVLVLHTRRTPGTTTDQKP